MTWRGPSHDSSFSSSEFLTCDLPVMIDLKRCGLKPINRDSVKHLHYFSTKQSKLFHLPAATSRHELHFAIHRSDHHPGRQTRCLHCCSGSNTICQGGLQTCRGASVVSVRAKKACLPDIKCCFAGPLCSSASSRDCRIWRDCLLSRDRGAAKNPAQLRGGSALAF